MGAGQIGGIATLLDMDFKNAAGFAGRTADLTEAHFIVYFMSHTMLFCTGSLIEAHVVLTPATCVYSETHKFEIFGGTHMFLEDHGSPRIVEHLCFHKKFNYTDAYFECSPNNMALLLLEKQYHFNERESHTEFVISRIRYGSLLGPNKMEPKNQRCKYYGWGSRRNGFLIPLLINLRVVETRVLKEEHCKPAFNYDNKYLCLATPACKSDEEGALCPDDLGSALVCDGFLRGMQVSRLIDRPCGVGYLDLTKFTKFLTCGVDDSRDVFGLDDYLSLDITTPTADHIATLNDEVILPHSAEQHSQHPNVDTTECVDCVTSSVSTSSPLEAVW